MELNRVTPEIVQQLVDAPGSDCVVTDEETLKPFASDYTEDLVLSTASATSSATTSRSRRASRRSA